MSKTLRKCVANHLKDAINHLNTTFLHFYTVSLLALWIAWVTGLTNIWVAHLYIYLCGKWTDITAKDCYVTSCMWFVKAAFNSSFFKGSNDFPKVFKNMLSVYLLKLLWFLFHHCSLSICRWSGVVQCSARPGDDPQWSGGLPQWLCVWRCHNLQVSSIKFVP